MFFLFLLDGPKFSEPPDLYNLAEILAEGPLVGGGYFTAPPLAVAEDLGGAELGGGLDSLGDDVLGQLAGQQEPDGSLDVLG